MAAIFVLISHTPRRHILLPPADILEGLHAHEEGMHDQLNKVNETLIFVNTAALIVGIEIMIAMIVVHLHMIDTGLKNNRVCFSP